MGEGGAGEIAHRSQQFVTPFYRPITQILMPDHRLFSILYGLIKFVKILFHMLITSIQIQGWFQKLCDFQVARFIC